MIKDNHKCSFKDHENIEANTYCFECKVYMCSKCEIFHSKLVPNHQSFNLNLDLNEIFTGLCKKHNYKIEFFCKSHNELCCAVCFCKIQKEEIGNHKDCQVCILEDIKEEKINKLKDNMKYLEKISNSLNESINKIKEIYEKLNEKKEELKIKIQKIFTGLRNDLNKREDELLLEVDKIYEELHIKEEIIKESEKLPNKIKLSIDKGKSIEKEINNNKLDLLIHKCIKIENNINKINIIQENIKKYNNSFTSEINFSPNEEEKIKQFSNTIKSFGKIININYLDLLNNSLILAKLDY